MTADERRRAILEALCVRRHETRENLAFEFGVSKSTIEHDVLRLSLEYPIYTARGNGGGIRVARGFRPDRKYLSGKQAELLEKLSVKLSGEEREVMNSILRTFRMPKRRTRYDDPRRQKRSSGRALLLFAQGRVR